MRIAVRQFEGLQLQAVLAAYGRMAGYYDYLFGPLLGPARAAAIKAVNRLPGRDVLEVGVGTGLALPRYSAEKRITGIDVSTDMLAKARNRAARLPNVQSLMEMDAEATSFVDGQFDIAIAMFVASVVPDPRALLTEMRRIVKPGGTVVIVNHFAEEQGVPEWWRRATDAVSEKLGWRADFWLRDIFGDADFGRSHIVPLPPLGFFDLVVLPN